MPDWNPPTLMGALAKRRANRLYKEGGWGRQLTFSARRGDGTQLYIQLRLPDPVDLTEHDSPADGPLVVSGDLTGVDDGGEREYLAALTVSFEDGRKPAVADYPDPDDPDVKQEVKQVSERAIQVTRISHKSPDGFKAPEPKLEIEYVLSSQFGALTFAFATTNQQMFGAKAQEIYRKICETGWIGTKKRPY
jgi:hypothetical protein